MAYFVIYALDREDVLSQRMELRESHRARLRVHDFRLVVHVGGPLTDASGAMLGSMLVVEAPDQEEVERFFAGDPYNQAGIFRSVEIRPFQWGLGTPERTIHG